MLGGERAPAQIRECWGGKYRRPHRPGGVVQVAEVRAAFNDLRNGRIHLSVPRHCQRQVTSEACVVSLVCVCRTTWLVWRLNVSTEGHLSTRKD